MAITLNKLEQHLWGAANILRGSIDSGEYKSYIFGLLFFKRLSDVWQEEFEQKLKEYGDSSLAADADEHRFDLPKGYRWEDVRKHTTNIGEHLNSAFQAVEDANMTSWSQSKVTESLWSGKKSEHMGYLSDEPLFA